MNMKKLGALLLAIVMVLALGSTALATSTPELGGDGETGTWGGAIFPKDNETIDTGKTITLKKELIVYNPNSHTADSDPVYAPAYSYVYTVTPATVSSYSVTDDATDHEANVAVTMPISAGSTVGLVVNGGTAGNATSAVGYLDLTNSIALDASSTGEANTFDFTINFGGVTFTQPGVYRYQIVETIIGADHTTAKTYDQVAVADGASNTRYLDVYVDGNLAIYGYVCMAANGSVTSSTTKTNGFVSASNDDENGADSYYTYDLTLSKDVVNDTYGENTIAFPFTVIFNNAESYATTFTITETAASGSTGISPATASAPTWSGVARVKDGADITYTGIPAGVDVDVYETNVATGVTYTVATSVNSGTAVTDANVSWGSAPASAVAQSSKAAYESTKATVDTTANTAIDATQTVAITNTLLLISPTGYVARIAPYVIMLAAGVALFIILGSKRRKKDNEA